MIMKPGEFAKLAGVSVTTLQRWDRDGILIADRSVTGRRVYTEEHLDRVNINRLGKAAQMLSVKEVKNKKNRVGRPGIDLTDRYFGELHVLCRDNDFVYSNGRRDVMWKCECSCGNVKSIRTSNLTSGGTISCGCMRSGRRYDTSDTYKRKVSHSVLLKTEAMVGSYFGSWYVDSVAYETCNGSDTKIRLNCICKCGVARKVLRSSLMNGTSLSCGCHRREVLRERDYFEDLTGRDFGLWHVESKGDTRLYPRGGQVIMWNCVCKCGTRKQVSRLALKSGESQSCGCMGEPGMRAEIVTMKCLDYLGLRYVRQKTYDNLLGLKGKSLSFDFEVYFDNRSFLIECQGEQHFKPVKFFGGDEVYKVQCEHDKRKREYCISNNIPLLAIPYTIRTYDAILDIIEQFLNTLVDS